MSPEEQAIDRAERYTFQKKLQDKKQVSEQKTKVREFKTARHSQLMSELSALRADKSTRLLTCEENYAGLLAIALRSLRRQRAECYSEFDTEVAKCRAKRTRDVLEYENSLNVEKRRESVKREKDNRDELEKIKKRIAKKNKIDAAPIENGPRDESEIERDKRREKSAYNRVYYLRHKDDLLNQKKVRRDSILARVPSPGRLGRLDQLKRKREKARAAAREKVIAKSLAEANVAHNVFLNHQKRNTQ